MKFILMPFILVMLPIAFIALAFVVAYDYLDARLYKSFIKE